MHMTRPGEGSPDGSTGASGAHDADKDRVTDELKAIVSGPLAADSSSDEVRSQVTAEAPALAGDEWAAFADRARSGAVSPPPPPSGTLRSTVQNVESTGADSSPSVRSTMGGVKPGSLVTPPVVEHSSDSLGMDSNNDVFSGQPNRSSVDVTPDKSSDEPDRHERPGTTAETVTDAEFDSAIDRIERADTATWNGREYVRGEEITYTTTAGKTGKYYVLCNTFGDPPGLALQSVENEALVFRVAGDVDPSRVSAPLPPEEPPSVDTPRTDEPPEDQAPPAPPITDPTPPPPPDGTSPDASDAESRGAFPELETSKDSLEEAILRLARAKDRSDSIFSKLHRKSKNESGLDDAGELQAASDHLKGVFAGYVGAVAGVCVEQTGPMRRDIERLGRTVLKDPANPDLGFADHVDPAMIERYKSAKSEMNKLEQDMTQMIVQEMASARYRVDQAQLEIKKSKPGGKFISKFRELWTKHPGWRAGIGVALTVGAIGVSTVAPPLGIGLFAAKRALGTLGTYMGVEGAGRKATAMKSEHEEKKAAKRGLEEMAKAFPRSNLEDVVENRATQYGAESLGAGGVEVGEAFPDEQRVNIERFVQDKFKEIMIDPDGLRAVLRGAEVNPSLVVDKLMEDRLVRLRRDSKWTRRSKYLAAAGAALVGAASLNQIKNALDARPHIPTPGGASKEDLNKAFFRGIELHHGPTTGVDFEHLKAGGMANAQRLWEASPNHAEVGKAFANGAWMDKLQGLSASDQVKAATLIGNQFDTGSLSESSINSIVTALS